jgi:hypothetical protein
LFRAVRIDGNGSASSLIEFGSTPTFFNAALITTSPTPFSALTAIVLPARSAGVRIDELLLTRMFCQLSDVEVPSTSLAATSVSGMPCVRAIIIGT